MIGRPTISQIDPKTKGRRLFRHTMPPSENDEQPSHDKPSSRRLPHVLVVDDNEDSAEMLRALLAGRYTTRIASDGEAALVAAAEFQPAIVLLDLGLPKIDGYEVARRIRAAEAEGPRAMIIAVTGFGRDEDRRRSREAGFDHHIVKPVDTMQLISLLEAAAPLSR